MSRDVPVRFWRGANSPRWYWGFDDAPGKPADLTGSAFTLVVAWPPLPAAGLGAASPGGSIRHTSDTGMRDGIAGDGVLSVDLATGDVSWPYTVAETVAIPQRGATYELFRTIGASTEVWCGGAVEVLSHLPVGALALASSS